MPLLGRSATAAKHPLSSAANHSRIFPVEARSAILWMPTRVPANRKSQNFWLSLSVNKAKLSPSSFKFDPCKFPILYEWGQLRLPPVIFWILPFPKSSLRLLACKFCSNIAFQKQPYFGFIYFHIFCLWMAKNHPAGRRTAGTATNEPDTVRTTGCSWCQGSSNYDLDITIVTSLSHESVAALGPLRRAGKVQHWLRDPFASAISEPHSNFFEQAWAGERVDSAILFRKERIAVEKCERRWYHCFV